MIFTLDGKDTTYHVLFLTRALKSSNMTDFRFGLDKKSSRLRGRGDGKTEMNKFNYHVHFNYHFDLNIPCMLRVVMEQEFGGLDSSGLVVGDLRGGP